LYSPANGPLKFQMSPTNNDDWEFIYSRDLSGGESRLLKIPPANAAFEPRLLVFNSFLLVIHPQTGPLVALDWQAVLF
jgi:hypothetical protein